ncbi:hypothetical protein LINPERPRIM_LOCUS20149 [Linum perenne]
MGFSTSSSSLPLDPNLEQGSSKRKLEEQRTSFSGFSSNLLRGEGGERTQSFGKGGILIQMRNQIK